MGFIGFAILAAFGSVFLAMVMCSPKQVKEKPKNYRYYDFTKELTPNQDLAQEIANRMSTPFVHTHSW